MPPGEDPGVTTASPAEPIAPSEPIVSEDVTNPGKTEEQTVPFSRFQETNDAKKAAEERAKELETQLEQSKQQPQTPQNEDDLDPDTLDLVNRSAKKLGYVTQDELTARETQIQVRQDLHDLEVNPPVPGIPFDGKAVTEFAKANGLPITSKAAFKAAYTQMNFDKIIEAERNRAVEGYKTAGSAGAEKPGSQGAQPPGDSKISGDNPKERTRSRIAAARQKLTV